MARYGNLEEAAEGLKKALKSAGTNERVVEAIISIAEGGKQLGAKNARKIFTDIFPEIAPVLGSNEDFQIAMDALQKAYDMEVRGKMKFTDELDWFLRSQSKLVEELRAMLTGLDRSDIRFFLQVTGERAISIHNIARNDYLPKIEPAFRAILKQSQPRLDKLLKKFTDNGVIERLQRTGFIKDFDLWRIKGEITEILALPRKQDYLEEIKIKFPNAILFEGVMAMTELTREGVVTAAKAPRQIWDGMIAEITSTGLNILMKFELKSGMQGFQQGFEQILSTHYDRFTSFGDELHVVLANGEKRIFKLSKTAAAPDSIRGANSQNVLLTPAGVSFVMPNQALQSGDANVITELLELDGREIHHTDIEALVLDFLYGLKLN